MLKIHGLTVVYYVYQLITLFDQTVPQTMEPWELNWELKSPFCTFPFAFPLNVKNCDDWTN